jgi:hypothetical protein
MSSVNSDNGWSNDIERVLDSIRHNASVMSDYHKKNYAYYTGQLKYYKIPVIILSGLNSVTAVGLQPYLNQEFISAFNCLLALTCGIIGSIELFLGISDGAESELKASKDFYLLSIDIYKTLTLDRRRRPMAKEFLDKKYGDYAELFRGSALIQSKKVTDKLSNVKFTCNDNMLDDPIPSTSKLGEFGKYPDHIPQSIGRTFPTDEEEVDFVIKKVDDIIKKSVISTLPNREDDGLTEVDFVIKKVDDIIKKSVIRTLPNRDVVDGLSYTEIDTDVVIKQVDDVIKKSMTDYIDDYIPDNEDNV